MYMRDQAANKDNSIIKAPLAYLYSLPAPSRVPRHHYYSDAEDKLKEGTVMNSGG